MPTLLVASAVAAPKALTGNARRANPRTVSAPAVVEPRVDAAADYSVLARVRETWDEAELLAFGEALWELYRQRWEARDDDALGLCDQLHLKHHRTGDYAAAARSAAAKLGKPFAV